MTLSLCLVCGHDRSEHATDGSWCFAWIPADFSNGKPTMVCTCQQFVEQKKDDYKYDLSRGD